MVTPQIGQGVVVDVPATTANLGPGLRLPRCCPRPGNRFELRVIEGSGERFDLIIEGPEGAHLRGGPDNLVYAPPSGCGGRRR
jgi:homoserine kinase